MTDLVLAIDIGGTNIKAGVVDMEGNVIEMIHRPSEAHQGREALLTELGQAVKDICAKYKVVAVGAGSPGTVDNKKGFIRHMQAHIPRWTGMPLADFLTEHAGLPAVIDNDVNCIALGENWRGAGRGYGTQISLALGTGLGGAAIIDGNLVRGVSGNAGELGHIVIKPDGEPCTCGNFGCAEVYTAPGAMTRRARNYLENGIDSYLSGIDNFTAKDIIEGVRRDDCLCQRMLKESTQGLALIMWNMTKIFDPDVFVMGGGFMNAGEIFTSPLKQALDNFYSPAEIPPHYDIKISELGDNAGIIGAAKLAWNMLSKR